MSSLAGKSRFAASSRSVSDAVAWPRAPHLPAQPVIALPCPPGHYGANDTSIACAPCPRGRYSGLEAQMAVASCRRCAGYSSTTGTFGATAAANCTVCPFGMEPDGSADQCGCERGRFGSPAASTDPDCPECACAKCGVGRFTAMPGRATCAECPAGEFSDELGRAACFSCAAGQFSAAPGATDLVVYPLADPSHNYTMP